jgi:hypothetical protein
VGSLGELVAAALGVGGGETGASRDGRERLRETCAPNVDGFRGGLVRCGGDCGDELKNLSVDQQNLFLGM